MKRTNLLLPRGRAASKAQPFALGLWCKASERKSWQPCCWRVPPLKKQRTKAEGIAPRRAPSPLTWDVREEASSGSRRQKWEGSWTGRSFRVKVKKLCEHLALWGHRHRVSLCCTVFLIAKSPMKVLQKFTGSRTYKLLQKCIVVFVKAKVEPLHSKNSSP